MAYEIKCSGFLQSSKKSLFLSGLHRPQRGVVSLSDTAWKEPGPPCWAFPGLQTSLCFQGWNLRSCVSKTAKNSGSRCREARQSLWEKTMFPSNSKSEVSGRAKRFAPGGKMGSKTHLEQTGRVLSPTAKCNIGDLSLSCTALRSKQGSTQKV